MNNPKIYNDGSKSWFDANGYVILTIWADGDESHYLDGSFHRENGPAQDFKSLDEVKWFWHGKQIK